MLKSGFRRRDNSHILLFFRNEIQSRKRRVAVMRKKKYRVQVKLNPKELRVLLEGMMWFRNQVIRTGGPTEDIDEFLLRIMK